MNPVIADEEVSEIIHQTTLFVGFLFKRTELFFLVKKKIAISCLALGYLILFWIVCLTFVL